MLTDQHGPPDAPLTKQTKADRSQLGSPSFMVGGRSVRARPELERLSLVHVLCPLVLVH
jgi:hypothetical protein